MSTKDQESMPKIIDFGLSTVINLDEKRSEGVGSIAYCSPEILNKNEYCLKTDIWSLGIALYALLCGNFPFLNCDKNITIKNIKYQKLSFNEDAWP